MYMDSLKSGLIGLHKKHEVTSKPWFHLANKLLFSRPSSKVPVGHTHVPPPAPLGLLSLTKQHVNC